MNKSNLLFVSIAFPPKSDAEGLQVAKYLKYLLREGGEQFDIDVVTSKLPTLNMSYDASLESASAGIRKKIELPILESKYTNFILRKLIPWMIQCPDSKFSFHHQAFRIPKLLRNAPELIYSRSFPASSAVMAYKLKKHYNVPWVMHLSDIWADSPQVQYGVKAKRYNERVERKCFESADAVCVTSKSTLDFYKRKYQDLSERIEFFPNVFDSEDIIASNETYASKKKLRLVHTGSLAGDRSPEPFLKALASLPIEEQNKLEIIFVGESDRKNKAILDYYRLPCFSYYGAVEYQKALELQRSADVLLLIDMPVEQPELRVFFPSKILDYIIAKKPVLALVDNGCEIKSVVDANQLGTCIERHDIEKICEHLLWLSSHMESDYFNDKEVLYEYDAAYNASRLIDRFNAFIRSKSRSSHS